MEKRSFTLKSQTDKLPIAVLMIKPENCEIKGVVQIVHGMCEYKERYLAFMEYLSKRGYIAVIHDHRGHGKSVRKKEDLSYMYGGGADALVKDVSLVRKWCRKVFPEYPFFLFGHSMGTLAVRSCIQKNDKDLEAVILSGSPSKNDFLFLGKIIASVQKIVLGGRHKSKVLEDLSFGPYAMKFWREKNKYAWLCSEKEVVKAYQEDPLCGVTFTTDAYLTLFDLMKRAYKETGWMCSNPDLPILFLAGEMDPCVGGPRRLPKTLLSIRLAGYRNVKGHLYKNMRHEILNESGKEKVYRDIVAFYGKTLKKIGKNSYNH